MMTGIEQTLMKIAVKYAIAKIAGIITKERMTHRQQVEVDKLRAELVTFEENLDLVIQKIGKCASFNDAHIDIGLDNELPRIVLKFLDVLDDKRLPVKLYQAMQVLSKDENAGSYVISTSPKSDAKYTLFSNVRNLVTVFKQIAQTAALNDKLPDKVRNNCQKISSSHELSNFSFVDYDRLERKDRHILSDTIIFIKACLQLDQFGISSKHIS